MSSFVDSSYFFIIDCCPIAVVFMTYKLFTLVTHNHMCSCFQELSGLGFVL